MKFERQYNLAVKIVSGKLLLSCGKNYGMEMEALTSVNLYISFITGHETNGRQLAFVDNLTTGRIYNIR